MVGRLKGQSGGKGLDRITEAEGAYETAGRQMRASVGRNNPADRLIGTQAEDPEISSMLMMASIICLYHFSGRRHTIHVDQAQANRVQEIRT